MLFSLFFFLMIRRPPRSTRTEHTLSLHDALPICAALLGRAGRRGRGRRHPGVDLPSVVPDPVGGHLHRVHRGRSEEHTSELQSLMRISYAVFCLKKKKKTDANNVKQASP